ncbi:hypothetical protein HUJ04_003111 [Dendroctonus ponderosae]|nr:hypothetical protein HUJ04_003111 [Dendroctonus ponderosae]KAH1023859.1 hypothetical protein HUJ05_003451 [Dendroctonus ponderosae]
MSSNYVRFKYTEKDLSTALSLTNAGQINDNPGEKWLQLFLRRNTEVAKQNTEIISKSRASVTELVIRKWFEDLLEF